MNTYNLQQQQPQSLFGEPQYVEGTAGKKQLVGEPQFVTGLEKHAEQITPLYTEPQFGARDPYLTGQEQLNTAPVGGEWQRIPISSEREQLYPVQEQFLRQPGMDGNEQLISGGPFQTGEHLSLSPDREQHVTLPPSTEHVHLNPTNQNVHLSPDTEHVHIKAGHTPEAGVDQVIRIKPDGRVFVTAEKTEEYGTSVPLSSPDFKDSYVPLDNDLLRTENKQEYIPLGPELKAELSPGYRKEYDTSLTQALNKPHTEHPETELLHTQEIKKKRVSDKRRHHDKTTETQTIVKIQEHEPGTAGYTKEGKLGKRDDRLDKDYDDTRHRDIDTHLRDIDTPQLGSDTTLVTVDKARGDTENVQVTTGKGEYVHDVHDTEHLKAGKTSKKEKLASDKTKHRHGTDETTVIVDKDKHRDTTDKDKHKGRKHKHSSDKTSHHHGPDDPEVIVDKTKLQRGTDLETNRRVDKDFHRDTSDKTKHRHGTDETTVIVDKDKHRDTSDKTKHRHGTDETTVIVDKDKHRDTTDKTKHRHGTDETTVIVDKDNHRDTSDKTKHRHGTDKTKVIVDKDKHRSGDDVTAVKVTDRDLKKQHTDTTTHIRAGTLSKPQDVRDRTESQGILQSLRTTLAESDTPNLDVIGELLVRAEVLLAKSANQPNVDPDARKTLEDISTLLITAKQMDRHKAIAERLQKISDECQKALNTVRSSDAPTSAVKSASKEAVDFINLWRPVFQLLIRSRDFRQLFVDSLRIAKRILSRHEGIVDDLSQKFIEGESAQGMRDRVREHREQNIDVSMLDEEWEYLQCQILDVLALLARNPTYHDALNKLFTLLDMFSAKSREAIPTSYGNLETHARKAKMETEELVVSFTGRETLNQFKFRLRGLIRSINNDPELKQYAYDLKAFILSSKSEEEIRSEAFRLRTRELVDRGQYLVNKYRDRNELDLFLEAANELIENIKNDEHVKELRARAGIVRSDLTIIDSEGRTKVDVDMLVKLQTVLIPVLADTFQKIHIPRIENSDPKLDFWADNIVLCGYDIFPDNIKFHVERDTELSIREFDTRGSHTRLVMHLDKLRTEVKNIEFYFKRKTFPSLSDSGLVTFRIPENGAHLSIYFTLDDRPGETHPRLEEGYAEFTIRKMDIEFDKSTLKHDVLIPMFTGLLKNSIKSKIEKAVETNLTNILKQLGDRLTLALGELNRQPVFGTIQDTIKTSVPHQVFQQRREKLE